MNSKTIALAGVLVLSSTLSFAQGGGNAASSPAMPENTGAAANIQGGVVGNTADGKTTLNTGTTTGKNGAAAKRGDLDASKPGGESTARKANGG